MTEDDTDGDKIEPTTNTTMCGAVHFEPTDDWIKLAAPEITPQLRAASTACTLLAETLEGRYGEENLLAAMYRTAARFANDVVMFDSARGEWEHDEPAAKGQLVDLMLLTQASLFFGEHYRNDANKGGDPDEYRDAGKKIMDLYNTAFRVLAIQAAGGRMEETEQRFHTKGPS